MYQDNTVADIPHISASKL